MQRRISSPLLLPLLLLSVLALACEGAGGEGGADGTLVADVGGGAGGRDGGADTAGGDDTTPGADVVTGPDSGSPADVMGDPPDVPAGDDAAAPGPVYGGVVLWEALSPFIERAGASADLRRAPLPALPAPTHDLCAVVMVDPAQPAALPASLDAGTIRISGALQPVTLTWSAALAGGGSGYAADLHAETEHILPAPGTVVTATADGGADVPGFTAAVATPRPVTLSAPSSMPFASVDSGEALTVQWTAGDGGTTVVSLNVIDGMDYEPVAGAALVCTLDGDPGQYVVPAAAMGSLPTEPGARVIIAVTRIRTVEVPVAGGSATFTVTASGAVVPLIN